MTTSQKPQAQNSSEAISVEALRSLVEHAGAPAISLLMPLTPSPASSDKTRLTLKNLVDEARRKLAAWPTADPDHLLTSLRAPLLDDTWWRGYGRGYAHYVAANGWSAAFRLPFEVGPRVEVNAHFAVRDLLPALTGSKRFYVLAVSQNKAQLYRADYYGMAPTEGVLVPGSLREAMQYFEHSNDLNTHGGGPYGGTFHGQGSQRDARKAELAVFLRGVDDAVHELVSETPRPPLVLAMVAEMAPLFRSVSRYPSIVDEVVTGNPDYATVSDVHARAIRAVEPAFGLARDRAAARFHDTRGSHLVSTSPADVVAGAAVGRVGVLLICGREPVWGRFEPATTRVTAHDEHEFADEDLVNRAAIETIAHGGVVHADVEGIGAPMAALFRY